MIIMTIKIILTIQIMVIILPTCQGMPPKVSRRK